MNIIQELTKELEDNIIRFSGDNWIDLRRGFKEAIDLLETMKPIELSGVQLSEVLKWQKLFTMMRFDFGIRHSNRNQDEGFYGLEVLENMFGKITEGEGEVKGICRVTIKDVEFMKRAEKEGIDILELWEREKGEVKKE